MPGAEPGEVVAVEHRVRHHEREDAASGEVLLGGAGDEQPGEILVGGDVAAMPEVAVLRHLPEADLHLGGHVPVGEPGWVADEDVDAVLRAGQPDRPGEVTDVVAPDVVSAFVVQPAQHPEVLLDGGPGRVADGQAGVSRTRKGA